MLWVLGRRRLGRPCMLTESETEHDDTDRGTGSPPRGRVDNALRHPRLLDKNRIRLASRLPPDLENPYSDIPVRPVFRTDASRRRGPPVPVPLSPLPCLVLIPFVLPPNNTWMEIRALRLHQQAGHPGSCPPGLKVRSRYKVRRESGVLSTLEGRLAVGLAIGILGACCSGGRRSAGRSTAAS